MDRKRPRLDSKAPSGTCEEADIDRISQLSDDILIAIISFLPLKEAACTSVLSSRWLNLWKHNPCLNFDVWSSLNNVAQQAEPPSKRRPKYVKWVNDIIRSHNALTLKEFRICFRLTQSANKVIARWLEFAFARHVQILELDMSEENDYMYCHDGRSTYCAFPETLGSGGASTSKRHSNRSRIDFKCLKVLSMKRVNVTGETIQLFLSNCPSLEKLVVDDAYKLFNVEVCGPSLVLKHLELVCCHDLKSIKVGGPSLVLKHLALVNCNNLELLKVSAAKLTSLILPKVDVFLLENVPMLVDVNVDCCYYGSAVKDLVPELSCCVSHLEVLTLKLTDNPQGILSTFSELPKLKKLVIKYKANGEKGLMGLTSLIRASPYLQEFVLEVMCLGFDPIFGEVENTMKFPHHHLKVFEFHGYVGHSNDLQLLAYIVENCVCLDKIIIDSRGRVLYCPEEIYERTAPGDYGQIAAAADVFMTQHLEATVPQHIELVIIYP